MKNTVLLHLFLLILTKASLSQDQINIFRDKFSTNVELKPIEDDLHINHISSDSNKLILNFLKSVTTAKKSLAIKPQFIKDPTGYCRSFRTCFECSRSIWYPCGWCHNYGCTDKPDKLCPNAMTKIDFVDSNTTNDLRTLCPYIEHHGSILLHAGMRKNIQAKLHASDPVLYEKELVCQLQFRNRVTHLKALVMNNVVYCYPVALDTVDKEKANVGSMRLIWGGVHPFSNKLPVSVYRCQYLAVDCESCRLISPEYGCGWCSEENVCTVADKCPDLLKWNINRLTCKSLGNKMLYV